MREPRNGSELRKTRADEVRSELGQTVFRLEVDVIHTDYRNTLVGRILT